MSPIQTKDGRNLILEVDQYSQLKIGHHIQVRKINCHFL